MKANISENQGLIEVVFDIRNKKDYEILEGLLNLWRIVSKDKRLKRVTLGITFFSSIKGIKWYNNNLRYYKMRLDKYLKVSRIIKRRTVAKEVADKGRIKVNGILAKSSTDLKNQ